MKYITLHGKNKYDVYDARFDLIRIGWVIEPPKRKGFFVFSRWEAWGYFDPKQQKHHLVRINKPAI